MPKHRFFISHSRRDEEGRLFIHDLFKRFADETGGLEPYFYPLKNPRPPHAQKIREEIADSEALVVLLSKWTLTDHTHSWVSFEVGVAAAHDLPVIVVEPAYAPIKLPVPGATTLMKRPRSIAEEIDEAWEALLVSSGRLTPSEPLTGATGFWASLFEAGVNALTAENDSTGKFRRGTCQRSTCLARFWVPQSIHWAERHPCPTCRDGVASTLVQLREIAEAAQRAQDALPAPAPRAALEDPTRARAPGRPARGSRRGA